MIRNRENPPKIDAPALGLDIGGTWCRAAVVDAYGRLKSRGQRQTLSNRSGAQIVEDCVELLQEVAAKASLKIDAVGVSVTGPVDPNTGTLYTPPNAGEGLSSLSLSSEISKSLGGIRVVVGKDTNAIALAEATFGAAIGVSDFVYVTISTGVGGSIVSGGRILLGSDGCAGELGHISVNPAGPECGCGRRGCLEALISGPALGKRLEAEREEAGIVKNSEHGSSQFDGAYVSAQAARGDPLAAQILDSAEAEFASAMVDFANLFNPALIVVGGSVARAHPEWLIRAQQAIATSALSPSRETTRIVQSALDDDGGLIGAALLLY